MENKRNIVNLREVQGFVSEIATLYPTHEEYIRTKVYRYLKHDAYLVEKDLYGIYLKTKIFLSLATSLEKKIFKNHGILGKYHLLPCSQGLFTRISAGINFLITQRLPRSTSFKEVLWEMDFHAKKTPPAELVSLKKDIDYEVIHEFPHFELRRLKTRLAYEQEGVLMKNCIGKSELPHVHFIIYSLRCKKSSLPVLSIKIERKTNKIIEAKEKVNRQISHFAPQFEKIKALLSLT